MSFSLAPQGSRDLAKAIAASLRRDPTSWQRGNDPEATMPHRSGVILWVYMGSAAVYGPRKIKFGWINWFRLKFAISAWRRMNRLSTRDTGEDIIAMLKALP